MQVPVLLVALPSFHAGDTLEFLSSDDLIEAALDHHEREVYFS